MYICFVVCCYIYIYLYIHPSASPGAQHLAEGAPRTAWHVQHPIDHYYTTMFLSYYMSFICRYSSINIYKYVNLFTYDLTIYLSNIFLSTYLPIYLSTYLPTYLSP